MPSVESLTTPQYFTIGLRLFFLSSLLIAFSIYSFANSINSTYNYLNDTCIIKSMDVLTTSIDCIADGVVSVVDMPCVLIYVDTFFYKNIKFYRNYDEKTWTIKNGVNVSFILF